jgi:hypothetical protein
LQEARTSGFLQLVLPKAFQPSGGFLAGQSTLVHFEMLKYLLGLESVPFMLFYFIMRHAKTPGLR